MELLGWTKTSDGMGGVGSSWVHHEGWTLEHCGHPTALRPWILRDAQGAEVRTGVVVSGNPKNGTTWQTMARAVDYVRTVAKPAPRLAGALFGGSDAR